MIASLTFFAPGVPSTKGSTKGFTVGGDNSKRPKVVITNDAGPKAKAWASVITWFAHAAMGGKPLMAGPVEVHVVFHLPRPQSDRGSVWSHKRPDADKLARCALDALTGVVFGDDSQIARLVVEKRYGTLGTVGAEFTVMALLSGA